MLFDCVGIGVEDYFVPAGATFSGLCVLFLLVEVVVSNRNPYWGHGSFRAYGGAWGVYSFRV